MPKESKQPKQFVTLAKSPSAKWVKIKKVSDDRYKFKLRTAKYLYTLVVKQKFYDLVKSSIPSSLEVKVLDEKDDKAN